MSGPIAYSLVKFLLQEKIEVFIELPKCFVQSKAVLIYFADSTVCFLDIQS